MNQRTTDIENNDAEKLRNALRAMAQNDFSRARCLLQEVVLNTPKNYIYSYEEGDTLFVRFWTEDELRQSKDVRQGQAIGMKYRFIEMSCHL
jgi:predicted Zn-dependent protease